MRKILECPYCGGENWDGDEAFEMGLWDSSNIDCQIKWKCRGCDKEFNVTPFETIGFLTEEIEEEEE